MHFRGAVPLLVLGLWALIWAAIRSSADEKAASKHWPTLAARFTNRGLQFFGSIGHKLVNKELPKTQFPDIKLPIDSGPGSGQVSVTGLQVLASSFQSPNFQFTLSPPKAIQFVSSGGSIPIQGQWSAYYTTIGVKITSSGWVQVQASDIESSLTLGITHLKGKPQLEVYKCSADVGQVDVHIGGGVIPWLINLFRSQVSSAIKQEIHDQFCLSVQTTLLGELNALLRSLPSIYPLGDSLFLDYSFQNDTQVTDAYIQSMAFANLLVQNDSSCPFGPSAQMPLAPSKQQWMLSIWLHGSVMNCLLWSVHRSNILQFTLNPQMDAGKYAKYLQTSCHFYEICLGRFFPELSRKYPGQHVDFHFHSASPPNAQFVPDNGTRMNLTADFFVDLHISPFESHPTILARLQMNSTAGLKPYLDGTRVKGKIDRLEVDFAEESSSIGNFSEKFLKPFSLLAKPIMEAALESALRVGLPLPSIEGIQLTKGGQLVGLVGSQQLRVDTNLEYTNLSALIEKYSRKKYKSWKMHEKRMG